MSPIAVYRPPGTRAPAPIADHIQCRDSVEVRRTNVCV